MFTEQFQRQRQRQRNQNLNLGYSSSSEEDEVKEVDEKGGGGGAPSQSTLKPTTTTTTHSNVTKCTKPPPLLNNSIHGKQVGLSSLVLPAPKCKETSWLSSSNKVSSTLKHTNHTPTPPPPPTWPLFSFTQQDPLTTTIPPSLPPPLSSVVSSTSSFTSLATNSSTSSSTTTTTTLPQEPLPRSLSSSPLPLSLPKKKRKRPLLDEENLVASGMTVHEINVKEELEKEDLHQLAERMATKTPIQEHLSASTKLSILQLAKKAVTQADELEKMYSVHRSKKRISASKYGF